MQAATSMPASDPLVEKDDLEFYGQRPWRQGHQSIDPPDPQMEKEGILALQFMESQVDHSVSIMANRTVVGCECKLCFCTSNPHIEKELAMQFLES